MLILLAAAPVGCGDAPAASPGEGRRPAATTAAGSRAVALTFDDLPGVAVAPRGCEPDALIRLNRRLIDGLRRNGVVAAGLVTGSRRCADAPERTGPPILREWLSAGHTLGNHTWSHRDYNDARLGSYLRDIERNQALLDSVAGPHTPRWYRAPFLHYGDTAAERDSLYAYLGDNGYRIARVSIDNQEWVFADAYARAKTRGDSAAMARIGGAYIPYMDSVFAFFERETEAFLGRYPPQVLLLHVNELNADRLDDLVAMVRRRGYRVIPMEDALADPWYAEPDGYTGDRGVAWLYRRAAAVGVEIPQEPRDPEWLAGLR